MIKTMVGCLSEPLTGLKQDLSHLKKIAKSFRSPLEASSRTAV